MTDYLVRLYDIPEVGPCVGELESQGICIRPARAYEKQLVVAWVSEQFSRAWADECEAGFCNHPVSVYIGVKAGGILGFACYDATCKNFFGPTGVAENMRSRGIGKALLLSCLHQMAAQGFAYAVIGGAGPADYYTRTVGALPIKGSETGIYGDRLMGSSL